MAKHRGCEHPVCMIPGCMSDVPEDSQYLRKRGVCLAHLRAHSVFIDGIWYRFCQQCGRFQPLSEFQDDRRSCEVALRVHNARRRMNYKSRTTQPPSTDTHVEKKSGAKKGAAAAAAAAQHYPWADPRWAAAAAAAAAGAYAASVPLAHSYSMPAGGLNSSSMAGWAAGYSAGVEGSPACAAVDPAGSALHCAPYAHMPGMEQYWLWQQQQGLWYPQQLQQSCAHLQHMPLLQQQHQQLQPEAAMSAACMYPGSDSMSGAAMQHPYLGADAAIAGVHNAPASYLAAQCRRPAPMPANTPLAPPQHSTMQQQQAHPDAGSNWDHNSPRTGDSEDLRAPLTPQHSDIDFDDVPISQGGAAEPAQHDDQEQQQPVAHERTAGAAAGAHAACAQQAQASAGAAAGMGASCHQADRAAHVAYARIAWPAPQRIDLAALLNMANRHAAGFTAGRAPAQLLQALQQQQQRRQASHQGAVDNAAGLQTPGAEAQCLPGTMWPGAEMQASAELSGSPALQSAPPSAVVPLCSHNLDAESAAGPAASEMQGDEGAPACAAAVRRGPFHDEGAPPPAASGCAAAAAAQLLSTRDSGVRSVVALDFSYANPAAVAFLENIGAIPGMLQASGHSGAQLAAAGSASALDQDLGVLLVDALDALLF